MFCPVLKCHSGVPVAASTASKDRASSPKNSKSAGSGHHTSGRVAFAGLDVSPGRMVTIEGIGEQDFLALVAFAAANAGGVVSLAGLEFLSFREINVAAFRAP